MYEYCKAGNTPGTIDDEMLVCQDLVSIAIGDFKYKIPVSHQYSRHETPEEIQNKLVLRFLGIKRAWKKFLKKNAGGEVTNKTYNAKTLLTE